MPKVVEISNDKYGHVKKEITFRKLFERQESGEQVFEDYLTDKELESKVNKRINDAKTKFSHLVDLDIELSPFLELAAGRGQNSSVLINRFEEHGFTSEISDVALNTNDRLLKQYKWKKGIKKVVCDMRNLPFADNCLSLVFVNSSIHHLTIEDMHKTVSEVHRVLKPGGHFYILYEPTIPILFFPILKIKRKNNPLWVNILVALFKTFMLHHILVSDREVADMHGILENPIPLNGYLKIMRKKLTSVEEIFNRVNVATKNPFKVAFIASTSLIFQGSYRGLYRKDGPYIKNEVQFICLDCKKKLDRLICPFCGRIYVEKNGITYFLEKEAYDSLYNLTKD